MIRMLESLPIPPTVKNNHINQPGQKKDFTVTTILSIINQAVAKAVLDLKFPWFRTFLLVARYHHFNQFIPAIVDTNLPKRQPFPMPVLCSPMFFLKSEKFYIKKQIGTFLLWF